MKQNLNIEQLKAIENLTFNMGNVRQYSPILWELVFMRGNLK